jgi:hypothetical protein
MLSFFSFSVVAGAKTFSTPDLKGAVKQLPSDEHVIEIAVGSNSSDDHAEATKAGKGNVADGSDSKSLSDRFKHADHYVCSVTGLQLVQVQKHYRTSRFSLDLHDGAMDIVAVYGADERDLRGYLGSSDVKCVLVRASSVFFLPFDAHTS